MTENSAPSYKVTKTIEDNDQNTQLIVELDQEHRFFDFDEGQFIGTNILKFQTGSTELEDGSIVEITRLVATCSQDHDHAVYYQSPRKMELWEAMFAIGHVIIPANTENGE